MNEITEDTPIADTNKLIAAEILHLDIDELVSMVISVHPEPFAIVDEYDFMQKVENVKRSIQYPQTRNAFYLKIAPLMSMLGDIHSSIGIPKYLLTSVKNPSSMSHSLFPFAVLNEKNGLFVAADLSPVPSVPIGAKIIAINATPVSYLLKVMSDLTAKETESGHRRRIQVDFPWLLSMMGYAKEKYQIDYFWEEKVYRREFQGISFPNVSQEPTKEENSELTIQATSEITSEKLASDNKPINEAGSHLSFYGFSLLTSKTALLWFNDFNENPQVFQDYLNTQFKKINQLGLTNLIIDVRYNDGGLSQNIKALISYLTNEPIYWANRGDIKISEPLKSLHKRKTKARRKNKYKWGLQWLPLEWTDALQYEISWSDIGETVSVNLGPIEPAENVQKKNIIVLTNGFCYSACSSLVAVVNRYKLAKTFGEIPGSFTAVQYAYPIKMKLSHSQLDLTLPTMKLIQDETKIDRKIIMSESPKLIEPSHPIERDHNQIKNRQDSILNQALREIERHREE